MMDHRRRCPLLLLVLLGLIESCPCAAVSERGSDVADLGSGEGTIRIGSCGCLVPIGGRPGIRLSISAWARLIWPSTSLSSSSTSIKGVAG